MFVEFRFDFLLELRELLPHIGDNIPEMALEFGSQTKFEFFTIHYILPPYVEKTALFGMNRLAVLSRFFESFLKSERRDGTFIQMPLFDYELFFVFMSSNFFRRKTNFVTSIGSTIESTGASVKPSVCPH